MASDFNHSLQGCRASGFASWQRQLSVSATKNPVTMAVDEILVAYM